MSDKAEKAAKQNIFKKVFRGWVLLIIILFAVIIAGFFYFQYQKTQKLLQNPTLVASEEAKALVAKVSAILELPKGEDPTIATVSDKNKLADQPFFANAQNGDKVLIYARAMKAILYRPGANKIIEVAPVGNAVHEASAITPTGPVLTTTVTVSPTLTPVPTKPAVAAKVIIYNGTKISGLAGTYERQLTDKFANIDVIKIGNANGDYTASIVVDLTGKNGELAKQIASNINGTVGALPSTETKPDADILVIIGK
jgi:hypothetical protein